MKKTVLKQPKPVAAKRSLLVASAVQNLGQQIQRERKSRGLTQIELGRLSSTSINFVSQLESGKPTARIEKVLAVLNALGLQISLERGRSIIRGLEK